MSHEGEILFDTLVKSKPAVSARNMMWLLVFKVWPLASANFYGTKVFLGSAQDEFMAHHSTRFGSQFSSRTTDAAYAHQAIASTSNGIVVGGTTATVLDTTSTSEVSSYDGQGARNAFAAHVQIPGDSK